MEKEVKETTEIAGVTEITEITDKTEIEVKCFVIHGVVPELKH